MKPKAAAMALSVSGHHLMEGAAGQAAVRQVGNDRGLVEGQGVYATIPQLPGRGMSRRSSSITAARFRANVWGASGPVIVESPICGYALDILCMFLQIFTLEQNMNYADDRFHSPGFFYADQQLYPQK